MQLEVVDSHNALPFACCLLLRLFRFGFDFVFWLKFVCSGWSLDYLVSAAALILFDQESPSPLACFNNCVLLNHWDSRFFLLSRRVTIVGLRIDLHERLKRSARMHFDSLSLLKVESTVCFQRKRRRERAVTLERYISFKAKNLESLPNLVLVNFA